MERIRQHLAVFIVLAIALVSLVGLGLTFGAVVGEPAHSPCVTEDEYLRFDGVCVHVDDIKADRG